jgi:predicted ATPase
MDMEKINILVGPNSSGKSSLIKALLTLKNSIDSPDKETVLGLNKEIGTYKNIVYNNEKSNKVRYKISFEGNGHFTQEDFQRLVLKYIMFKIANQYNEETKENVNIDKILARLKKKRKEFEVDSVDLTFNVTPMDRVVVEEFYINFEKGHHVRIFREKDSYRMTYNKQEISVRDIIKPYKFYFKVNEDKVSKLEENEIETIAILDFILNDIEKKMTQFANKLKYIEPLRNKFERIEYVTNLQQMNTVGSKGENTLTTLLGIYKEEGDTPKNKKIKEKIDFWLKSFDLGESMDIQKLDQDNYSLKIKNKYTGIYNNILDMGVGTSQLLPIIIESVNSEDGSTLIIEEPETHIHPNAQSKLADLFVDSAIGQNKKFIIETHSIFLITQLQILVAKGKIDYEDIRIYYFKQGEEGSKIINMKLTEKGQFQEEWPSGFFDIHYELGKKLFKYL